jgi:hypothetical protein
MTFLSSIERSSAAPRASYFAKATFLMHPNIFLRPPHFGIQKISFDQPEFFHSIFSLKDLVIKNHAMNLDYFIVLSQDGFQNIQVYDANLFLKYVWNDQLSNLTSPTKHFDRDFVIYRTNRAEENNELYYFCSREDLLDPRYIQYIKGHDIEANEEDRQEAFISIAQDYARGTGLFGQNYMQAFAWYERAAQFHHPVALCCLAIMKEDGQGTTLSLEQAFSYMQEAAKHNKRMQDPRINYMLARYYEEGIGIEKNPQKALEFYLKSAEKGFLDASQKVESLQTTNCL